MSTWACTEPGCDAHGETPDRRTAARALDRHWYETHRGEGGE